MRHLRRSRCLAALLCVAGVGPASAWAAPLVAGSRRLGRIAAPGAANAVPRRGLTLSAVSAEGASVRMGEINTPDRGLKFKAVWFDLDDTLWECGSVIRKATQAQFAFVAANYPNIQTDPEMFRAEMLRQKAADPDGGADMTSLRRSTIHAIATAHGYDGDSVADATMEVFLRERNNVILFPGVLPMLGELREAGLLLGAITNGNAQLSETPLRDELAFCVSAGALGAPKPAARPFQDALQRSGGLEPGEVLHVGDSLEADVAGAHALGIRTVWLNLTGKDAPEEHCGKVDATITDIQQLPEIVRMLQLPFE